MSQSSGDREKRSAEEGSSEPLPYPKGAFFILVGYFLERFVYYGLFGGAVFYLQRVLEFQASTASTIKAAMEGLIYLAPIAGAIIADTYLGKFRIVLYMCCGYVVGAILFSGSSVTTIMSSVTSRQVTGIGGIFAFGMCAGLMKAAYSSFGPDQFILPEQRRQQQRFFYAFYWMINAGACVGQLMTAQLRDTVQCFGDDCYALPFAILCCLMVVSLVIFYSGKKYYREVPPDPMLKNCLKSLLYAGKKSITDREKPVDHWLDRAGDKYDAELLSNVKQTFRVLLLFTPWPLFWALFFQTSTGMIFQAKRLDGYIGNYRVPPEMMPTMNPFLILLLIPLLEFVIYPCLERRNLLTKITSRMSIGMVLASIAFVIFGLLNMQVEQPILDYSTAQLNVYNADSCMATIDANWMPEKLQIEPNQNLKLSPVNLYNHELSSDLVYSCGTNSQTISVHFEEKHETTVVLFQEGPKVLQPTIDYLKDVDADAKVRMISNNDKALESFTLRYRTIVEAFGLVNGLAGFQKLNPQKYVVQMDNQTIGNADIRQDGVYDVVITNQKAYLFVMTAPSRTHVLWLLPQFITITVGEVLFSVSCLDFAYTEAPPSLKSFMQSLNLLTLTIGLWLYAVFTKVTAATKIFEHRASSEAFTYAASMAINTIIFQILVSYYYRKKASTHAIIPKRQDTAVGQENPSYQENEHST